MTKYSFDSLDIGAIIEQDKQERQIAKTQQSVAASVGTLPDRHAETLKLADKTALPVDVVDRNLEQVRKQSALDSLDIEGIVNNTPEARNWLADHDNAKLVSDDFSAIGTLKYYLNEIPRQYQGGKDQIRLNDLRFNEMFGALPPEEAAEASALEQSLEGLKPFTGSVSDTLLLGTANTVPQVLDQLKAGAAGGGAVGVATGAAYAGSAALGGQLGPQAATPEEIVTVPIAFVGGFIRGFMPGAMTGAAYENFRQQTGNIRSEMLKITNEQGQRLDQNVVNGAAIVAGAASAGLDLLPLQKLLNTVPGFDKIGSLAGREAIAKAVRLPGAQQVFFKIGKKLAEVGITEGGVEAVQQIIQIGATEAAKGLSEGEFEPISFDDAARQTYEAARAGLIIGTGIATPTSALSIPYELRKARQYTPEQVQAHVDTLTQAVRESKLFQRSPERFHQLAKDLAGDERFYVSAASANEVISQLPIEQQNALFNAVPDLRVELQNGIATNADIAISKADYAAFIAPFPQADTLRDHIKLDPEDMSIAERQDYQDFIQQNPELVQDIQTQVSETPSAVPQETYKAIERIVKKAMQEGGRSAVEAKNVAPLFARTLARFAAPFEQNPLETLNQNVLQFQTVNEEGQPIAQGSNIDVLLQDLEKVRKGEKIIGLDQEGLANIEQFGQQLIDSGLSIEEALQLGGEAVYNQLFQNTVQETQGNAQTLNQQGDITETPEFKAWFGDSRVVDENGKPLVVYHGTSSDFEYFDEDKIGSNYGVDDKGFFFTSSVDEASYAAEDANHSGNSGENIIPTYLSIEDPYIIHTRRSDSPTNFLDNNKEAILLEAEEKDADGIIVVNNQGDKTFVAFSPSQIKSIFNQGTFNPNDPRILHQKERGSITFSKDFEGNLRKVVVSFTSRANFSTAVHEFSHWAVATHRTFAQAAREQIAEGRGTPEIQRILDDWEKLKEQVGATDDNFTVEQEEKIASLFEGYMREGAAPSEALRKIFTRFRQWLTQIYRDVLELGVELNDEVRGVFDRWIASEDEIAKVRGKNSALEEIAKAFGFAGDVTAKIADYVNSAAAQAEEKVYRELSREQKRRETKAYEKEFESMRKKVAERVVERRIYAAIQYMKDNGIKVADAGAGVYSDLFTNEDGVHPDIIADIYGYESGTEFVKELRQAKDFDQVVDRETKQALQAKYPDMIADGRIQNKAVNAIMNDRVLIALDLVVKELGGFSRTGMRQFAKVIAQQQVAKMKLSEVNYSFRYDVARERELRSALQASRQGKAEEALLHVQRAMVNQTIFKSLEEYKALREKAEDLFKRVNQKDKKLAPGTDIDFLGAARFILNKYGLGGENFDIAAWFADVKERDPDVAEDLIAFTQIVSAPEKPAKDLTTAEFKDIVNAVENIFHIAREQKQLSIEGRKVKTKEAVAQLVGKMGEVKAAPSLEGTQVHGKAKLRANILGIKAILRRVEHWTDSMDGKYGGPFRKYLFQPISDASVSYRAARADWMKGLNDILTKHKERLTQPGKIAVPEMLKGSGIKQPMVFRDRLELIGFLLHTGNESNLEKLLGGYGITRESYDAAMRAMQLDGRLQPEDYQIVQDLWDFAERLKPLSQKAHKSMYGYRFEEIEPTPIKTEFGKENLNSESGKMYRGGYWPAIADYEQVDSKNLERALSDAKQFMLASTNKGFTKSRVASYQKPLSTDLRLASQHIDSVLRFAYLEPAVRQVSRIVNNADFKDTLKSIDSQAYSGMLLPWLQRVARQTVSEPPALGSKGNSIIAKAARFMRTSTSAQAMMLNISNAIQNITGFSLSIYKVGPRNFAKSLASYIINPIAKNREIRQLSTQMQVRQSVLDNDIANEINEIVMRQGLYKQVKNAAIKHGYVFQRLIQNFVDNVTWSAAYSQWIERGHSDADAIKYADSVVRETQGSAAPEDISQLEAGSEPAKLFLMFYSYFNNVSNMVGTEARTILRDMGWAGTPKLFYMYMMTVAIPAFTAELMVKALRDDLPGDEDDDGEVLDDWLAWFSGAQWRYSAAMFPYIGHAFNAAMNSFNKTPLDDRITASPAAGQVETVVRFITKEIKGGYEDKSREIRDALNTLGFITGLPLGQLGKPLGYMADVEEGDVSPRNAFDYTRGLVAGSPPANR